MISIVIPTYNATAHILVTLQKLEILILRYPKIKEVIFVNDYSTDDTLSVIIAFKNKFNDKIRVLNLKKNFGQHPATLIGILHTKTDYCLTMDDDVLFENLEIEHYISLIELNSNCLIYLVRDEDIEKKMRFKIITTIFRWISKRDKISPIGSSQRFFSSAYFKAKLPTTLRYIFLDVLFLLMEYQSTYRINDYTKHLSNHYRYSFVKRVLLVLNSLVYYTSFSSILNKSQNSNQIFELETQIEEIYN